MTSNERKLTISVLVHNGAGILESVVGYFTRRECHVESLAVGTTEDPTISRMTLSITGGGIEDVTRALTRPGMDGRLIKVSDYTGENLVEREIALVKVKVTADTCSEILQLMTISRVNIADVSISEEIAVIEIIGHGREIDTLLDQMKKTFTILEVCRSGRIVMVHGAKTLHDTGYAPR